MQQTFYIDNDEEISSVIDRLKKSLAKDNYVVVPRRAIFLQSIVNLKLLKREADKLRKRVIIVTQDELGMNMAEKAGVEVRNSLDGLEQETTEEEEGPITMARAKIPEAEEYKYPDQKVRLKEVGSSDFYGGGRHSAIGGAHKRSAEIVIPKKEAVRDIPIRHGHGGTLQASHRGPVGRAAQFQPKLDPQKEKQLEKMFEKSEEAIPSQHVAMGGKTKKIFIGFLLLCFVAFAGVAAFLFLPKATITVTTFLQKKKIDADIIGKTDVANIDTENLTIPVRILESQQNVTFGYEATGQGDGPGEKAKGNITIYNNFSTSSQQLIATTRFESSDGKIFRLTKNVVVPGQTVVNGETKPGAIEAEVIADGTGEQFNIEPTNFTIPGFKDSPKYEKFSATSTKVMAGGSSTGGGEITKTISQKDIDLAKKDVEAKLKAKIKGDLESQLKNDEVLLDEAMKYALGQLTAFGKAGDKKSSFDCSANATASAIVFLKKDVEKIVEAKYKKSAENFIPIQSLRLDYAGVTPDFDKKTLSMRLHSELTLDNPLVADDFKKELLGKNESQIEQLIQKYPTIKNLSFEFQPSFLSRVPQYEQRVEVVVESEKE